MNRSLSKSWQNTINMAPAVLAKIIACVALLQPHIIAQQIFSTKLFIKWIKTGEMPKTGKHGNLTEAERKEQSRVIGLLIAGLIGCGGVWFATWLNSKLGKKAIGNLEDHLKRNNIPIPKALETLKAQVSENPDKKNNDWGDLIKDILKNQDYNNNPQDGSDGNIAQNSALIGLAIVVLFLAMS
jgi:hypothetical protein